MLNNKRKTATEIAVKEVYVEGKYNFSEEMGKYAIYVNYTKKTNA
jgi:hypothetical protein